MWKAKIVRAVASLTRATQPLPETSPKQAIEALVGGRVEACCEYHGTMVAAEYHPLVAAVHAAFNDHRPLVLSPDMLWLLIAQGLARHLNQQSDELREQFVEHQGQATIKVRRDDFRKGSPENPWAEVFPEFSEQIRQHIGDVNHRHLVASFSTTGPIEKAANEIVLLNSMQSYFKYELHTLCGIPEVRLEGTPDDWHELATRAEAIGATYQAADWTDRIVPTLRRIVANADGADDPDLWNDIYKIDDGSGGPYIDGWIINFFPYLQRTVWVDDKDEPVAGRVTSQEEFERCRQQTVEVPNWSFEHGGFRCVTTENLPGSLCHAPFLWHYLGSDYQMEFLAGFVGFTQSADDLAVRPKIAWAVREVGSDVKTA